LAEPLIPILVVEDEREIRELMALHLLRQGYRVQECASAEEALHEAGKQKFQLFILDWMLPGLSGVDIIAKLKKDQPHASVLMVTARAEPQDIVNGLEKGADDFLTKPFDPAVLIARVKALLRRFQVSEAPMASEQFELDALKIDFRSHEVLLSGEELHLTPSEFKLLGTMVHNRGRVLTRDQLIENILGEGINVTGRTIDTHVFGLRKKLKEWGEHIETIRGVGYRIKSDEA
jgi:DNA-binding response OmpR family regulator